MGTLVRYIGRCFLVLLGIFVALICVEGARRMDNRVRRGIPLLTNPSSLWDARRGWVGKEHLLGPVSSNPILVLGDSFTEGLTVPSEQMWFAYLQREFPQTQIIAYGGLGYSTLQELIVLEDYLKRGLRPSFIVIQVCSNDIINNYYPLEVSSYAQRPPAPRPYLEQQQVVVRFPRAYGEFLSPIIGISQVAYALSTRWDMATVQRAAIDSSGSIESRIQRQGFSDPAYQSGIQVTKQLLARIKDVASGVLVLLMVVDDVEPYTSALRDSARDVGLPIIVPQRIRSVPPHGKLPDGAHLNEEGNRIVGETFIKVARTRGLLAGEVSHLGK
jgi:lysophospholipase L1-like esterase